MENFSGLNLQGNVSRAVNAIEESSAQAKESNAALEKIVDDVQSYARNIFMDLFFKTSSIKGKTTSHRFRDSPKKQLGTEHPRWIHRVREFNSSKEKGVKTVSSHITKGEGASLVGNQEDVEVKNYFKEIRTEYRRIKSNIEKREGSLESNIDSLNQELSWASKKLSELKSPTSKNLIGGDPALYDKWIKKFGGLKKEIKNQVETLTEELRLQPQFKESHKLSFKQSFGELIGISNKLNAGSRFDDQKLVLFKDGHFGLSERREGLSKHQQGTSAQAKRTLRGVIFLMKTGTKNHLFTQADYPKIEELEMKLRKLLKPQLAHYPELKKEFDEVFSNYSYVDQLQKKCAPGKPLLGFQFYNSLLDPSEKALREDFLTAGAWMGVSKKDRRTEDFSMLVGMMMDRFQKGDKQEKLNLLAFAGEMISRDLLPREKMSKFVTMALQDTNSSIKLNAQRLSAERPKPVVKAEDVLYQMMTKENELDLQLNKLAKKSGDPEKIVQLLAEDLSTVSKHVFMSIHPTELNNQAWAKAPSAAPNIAYAAKLSNTLYLVPVNKILMDKKLIRHGAGGRIRLYEGFVRLADRLVKEHRDYSSAQAILLGLDHYALRSLIKKDAQKHPLSEEIIEMKSKLDELFSNASNGKNLTKAMHEDEVAGRSYVPPIATTTKNLTFADDGNREQSSDVEEVNLNRLRLISKIQKKHELTQQRIKEDPPKNYLFFDIPSLITQAPSFTDKQYIERNNLVLEARAPRAAKSTKRDKTSN